jgi:predicted transcriptional regulator
MEEPMNADTPESSSVELAVELTIAYLSNPNTRATADDVPSFLKAMHEALEGLSNQAAIEPDVEVNRQPEFTPAVTVRKSLASREHIISMIDGRQYKTLTRHLSTNGLTPDAYRERYGLKSDYPMTAPAYSEARSAMAKKIGLGRKLGQKVTTAKGTGKTKAE